MSRPSKAALALVPLLAAAACQTAAQNPLKTPSISLAADQTLRVRLTAAVHDLDPALATSPSDLAVLRQYTEPLLRPAADNSDVVPAAAMSYDVSADGLTYTFHLRDNGHYSDGRPVRAQDFLFAWRRLIDPSTASPSADLFAQVVRGGGQAESLDPKVDAARLPAALAELGLAAPDDSTFQVTSPQPEGWVKWIAALPQGAPLRQDVLAQGGASWASKPDSLVGNGPFKVSELDPADHVTLLPSLAYWGARPTLNKLQFVVVTRDAQAISDYAAGRLEVAPLGLGEPANNRNLVRSPELTEFWIDFNALAPPFDNEKVRAAFAAAVDRAALVKGPLGDRAVAATALIPSGMSGHHPADGAPQEFNPEQAKHLLAVSGVSADALGGIHFLVPDRPSDRAVADFVAAELKRNLGVIVAIDVAAVADYEAKLGDAAFQMAGPDGWTADYPDQQDWFDLFRSFDSHNRGHWRNQRYDLLVRQADGERDAGRRDQLYQQAEQLLVQSAPVAFLDQRFDWSLVKPYVQGATGVPGEEWPGALAAGRLYLTSR